MPELPEVETIRQAISKDIISKVIDKIEILEKKQFIGNPKDLKGKKIIDVQRKGKVMAIKFDDNLFISIHLKLTGQLLFSKKLLESEFKTQIPLTQTNKMPGKTTRVIVHFKDSSALFFNDMRKFGWMKLSNKIEGPKSIDILDKNFTCNYFGSKIKSSGKPIKILLMDQDKMAGIGNIYANEALFLSKIDPRRKSKSLTRIEIKNLYNSLKIVINKGLKYQGSSGRDEAYILPDGTRGGYQNHFLVYQKEGKQCPKNCGGKIERIKQAGRSSFICINCQR